MQIYQGFTKYNTIEELLNNLKKESIAGKIYLDNGYFVVSLHPNEIKNRKNYTVQELFNYAIELGRGYPSELWQKTKNKK